jgi:hypothetical protein
MRGSESGRVFERFIARQAIFKDNLTLLGYNLRFRGEGSGSASESSPGDGVPPESAHRQYTGFLFASRAEAALSEIATKGGYAEDRIPECFLAASKRAIAVSS